MAGHNACTGFLHKLCTRGHVAISNLESSDRAMTTVAVVALCINLKQLLLLDPLSTLRSAALL